MSFKKIITYAVALTLILGVFTACGNKADNGGTTGITSVLNPVENNSDSAAGNTTEPKVPDNSELPQAGSQKPDSSGTASTDKKGGSSPAAESTSSKYNRTGVMKFSDSADNKFIKAVVQNYGVDASLLAAIYTVPDANGNMVLMFDGTTDKNGKLIRNAETLKAIYTVKKDLTCKCASEDKSLSEYSANESKVIFLTTEKYILPEYEAQLKK